MFRDPIERLLAVSSPALSPNAPLSIPEAGRHEADLVSLLHQRNGFYAFESALHVLPSGSTGVMSIEAWNDPELWRKGYGDLADGFLFFAEDVFGGQFTLSDQGVGSFDPETGDVETIAKDLRSWASGLLRNYEPLTGFPLAHAWQAAHGALLQGQRLSPKLPFVGGGAFDVANLYAADAVESMRFRADLASQIRDLPDGAKISFRVVE